MADPLAPVWGPLTGTRVHVRPATAADLPALVALLDADPAHLLVVAADGDDVVGTLQLSFIPGLSRGGALRAQIEGVRVRGDRRNAGLGRELLRWAIESSRRRGCGLVQLTTDRSRADASRFHETLGFVSSHVGYKLAL